MDKISLSPPPNNLPDMSHYSWKSWFEALYTRVGSGPFGIQGYTVEGLPDPTQWGSTGSGTEFSSIIFVSDEAGGAVLAFSNGTNWLRVTDRTIVS